MTLRITGACTPRLKKLLSEQMLHNEALRTYSPKMVRPEARRPAVRYVQSSFGLSERGACRALGLPRATQWFSSKKAPQDELLTRMRELAAKRPRAGYRTLYRLLRREGSRANHKRVYRLYHAEGLSLRLLRSRARLSCAAGTS